MSVKLYSQENLPALARNYPAAFQAAEYASFDLSLPWFFNLLSTALRPEETPVILVAEGDGGQALILPLCRDVGERRLRRLQSLANFYTSLYAPIAMPGTGDALLREALGALKHETPAWDEIRLHPLANDQPYFDGLFAALRCGGWLPFKYFCFGNWYLPVCGRSFHEYYESLPSTLKNTLKRKKKQFFAVEGGTLEIITGGDRMESGIANYEKVYAMSWKLQEPFPEFIPGLIRTCAEHGWLRLGMAYLQGQPVAAQLWIVAHGRAAIFKLAYDEKFARYSPGSILTAHMMQHVLDVDGVGEVDYLIGDDPYKKHWMSHRRERWGIVAYNPRTLPGLAGAFKQALGAGKRFLSSLFRPEGQSPAP